MGVRRRTSPFPPRLERLVLGFFLLQAWHRTVIAAEPPSPEEQASAHLDAGNERLDAGDFAGALAEFRAGFAVFPRTSLLFDIGVAELGLGHLVEASDAFEGVLARPETTPEIAGRAREQLARLERKLAVVEVRGAPGAILSLDGKERGTLPLKSPLHMLPGPHQARAEKPGHRPIEQQFTGEAGQRVDLAIAALEPLPPPRSRTRYWVWATVGAAVVAGAVIGFVAVQSKGPECTPERPCKYFTAGQ